MGGAKRDKAPVGLLAGDAQAVRARRTGTRTGTPWELYYLPDDFSQARNVAAEHPDKVKELQELWWKEAERNRVLPLMAGMSVMYGICRRCPRSRGSPSPATCRTSSAA